MSNKRENLRSSSSKTGGGVRPVSASPKKRNRAATSRDREKLRLWHGFDVRAAAQSAAYFARMAGGSIDMLKLVKLMYLAERDFMERYDEPLYYDRFVSMDYGPVPSMTLNLINGMTIHGEWSKYIGNRKGRFIQSVGDRPLDHLSKAETEVLARLWKKFADYDGPELAKWTHDHCREWQDPQGSTNPITHESVFRMLGKERASALAKEAENYRSAKAALAAAGG